MCKTNAERAREWLVGYEGEPLMNPDIAIPSLASLLDKRDATVRKECAGRLIDVPVLDKQTEQIFGAPAAVIRFRERARNHILNDVYEPALRKKPCAKD